MDEIVPFFETNASFTLVNALFEIYTLAQIRIICKNFITSWTGILYHARITSRAWLHNNSFLRYVHQAPKMLEDKTYFFDYVTTWYNFSN